MTSSNLIIQKEKYMRFLLSLLFIFIANTALSQTASEKQMVNGGILFSRVGYNHNSHKRVLI